MGRFKYTCIIITIYFAFNKLVRAVTENKILGKEATNQITIKTLLNSLKNSTCCKRNRVIFTNCLGTKLLLHKAPEKQTNIKVIPWAKNKQFLIKVLTKAREASLTRKLWDSQSKLYECQMMEVVCSCILSLPPPYLSQIFPLGYEILICYHSNENEKAALSWSVLCSSKFFTL